MSREGANPAAGAGPAWLSYGFRPFFLGAAAWSAVALGLWAGVLTRGWSLPSRFEPLSWHIHEMLFGFVIAGVAGFMLTAVPTGRAARPFAGRRSPGSWACGRREGSPASCPPGCRPRRR